MRHPAQGATGGWVMPGLREVSFVWVLTIWYFLGLVLVKLEMARVNVNILGIGELKWTGWVNLTQMTIKSTTVGRNPLEEME